MSHTSSTTRMPGLAEETIDPLEETYIESLKKLTMERLRGQYPDGSAIRRDAHPKTHGLVSAEFIVLDDFSHALRHGVFKTPRTFDALIRFSAGDVFPYPDTRVPRSGGMAIKLFGVEGDKLLPREKQARTQDFIMINFPGFLAQSFQSYEALHIASTPETRARFYQEYPPEEALYKRQSLEPFNNPLQVRYFSQVPYMLGPTNAIKFSAKPITNAANRPPASEGPDFLREVMTQQLAQSDVYFDFMVQVQTDPVRMPIEDSLTIWDEAQSPFQRVAVIRIPRQDITVKGLDIAEHLAFTPWHALPEHRPLGNMNRTRRVVYEMVSEFRRTANGVAREEPTAPPV
jgi:hypothetical protein